MKRLLVVTLALGLAIGLAAPAFCAEAEDYGPETDYRYRLGSGLGPGHMMGYGSSRGGGHMMGYGHHGWGMNGRGWGWGPSHRGWKSMKPKQREQWEKMWSSYQMDTLELRKQLAAKQMELETLWAQPNVDTARVEKLSKEVADLEAKLWKKRDKYLLQCRQQFGDQGWACPGGRW